MRVIELLTFLGYISYRFSSGKGSKVLNFEETLFFEHYEISDFCLWFRCPKREICLWFSFNKAGYNGSMSAEMCLDQSLCYDSIRNRCADYRCRDGFDLCGLSQ